MLRDYHLLKFFSNHLFNDAGSTSRCVVLNDWMISEWWIRKDVEGSCWCFIWDTNVGFVWRSWGKHEDYVSTEIWTRHILGTSYKHMSQVLLLVDITVYIVGNWWLWPQNVNWPRCNAVGLYSGDVQFKFWDTGYLLSSFIPPVTLVPWLDHCLFLPNPIIQCYIVMVLTAS